MHVLGEGLANCVGEHTDAAENWCVRLNAVFATSKKIWKENVLESGSIWIIAMIPNKLVPTYLFMRNPSFMHIKISSRYSPMSALATRATFPIAKNAFERSFSFSSERSLSFRNWLRI